MQRAQTTSKKRIKWPKNSLSHPHQSEAVEVVAHSTTRNDSAAAFLPLCDNLIAMFTCFLNILFRCAYDWRDYDWVPRLFRASTFSQPFPCFSSSLFYSVFHSCVCFRVACLLARCLQTVQTGQINDAATAESCLSPDLSPELLMLPLLLVLVFLPSG